MRQFLLGGATILMILACGAVDELAPATVIPTEQTPTEKAPIAGKRGNKPAGDCVAYCQKWESCAHTEGWEFDPADCSRTCQDFAAHPQGGGIITCLIETQDCVAAISCNMGE